MKTTLNTVRVGLFFLVGLALIWIAYEALSTGRAFREDSYTLNARFETIQTLRSGDDVRMSGVRIGRVGETRLENGKALTGLEISPDVEIARNSEATIAMAGMLGGQYVSISPGDYSEGTLSPGDEIGTRHTADLSEIMDRLGSASEEMEGLFSQVSVAVGRIAGTDEEPGVLDNLDVVLRENREALRNTLSNVESISEKIDRGEGTLARLINDDSAYEALLAAIDEIESAAAGTTEMIDGATEIVAHVRSGEGTLGRLIFDEEVGREIGQIAANLRDISDKIAAGEGTLGRLVVDDSLYNDIQAVVQKAERTIDGLGEQGPITAVGIAANALF